MCDLTYIINIVGQETVRAVIGLVGVLALVVLNALVLTWLERKISGHIQKRIGPKEVGPYGLIQPIADSHMGRPTHNRPPWTKARLVQKKSMSIMDNARRRWLVTGSGASWPRPFFLASRTSRRRSARDFIKISCL